MKDNSTTIVEKVSGLFTFSMEISLVDASKVMQCKVSVLSSWHHRGET